MSSDVIYSSYNHTLIQTFKSNPNIETIIQIILQTHDALKTTDPTCMFVLLQVLEKCPLTSEHQLMEVFKTLIQHFSPILQSQNASNTTDQNFITTWHHKTPVSPDLSAPPQDIPVDAIPDTYATTFNALFSLIQYLTKCPASMGLRLFIPLLNRLTNSTLLANSCSNLRRVLSNLDEPQVVYAAMLQLDVHRSVEKVNLKYSQLRSLLSLSDIQLDPTPVFEHLTLDLKRSSHSSNHQCRVLISCIWRLVRICPVVHVPLYHQLDQVFAYCLEQRQQAQVDLKSQLQCKLILEAIIESLRFSDLRHFPSRVTLLSERLEYCRLKHLNADVITNFATIKQTLAHGYAQVAVTESRKMLQVLNRSVQLLSELVISAQVFRSPQLLVQLVTGCCSADLIEREVCTYLLGQILAQCDVDGQAHMLEWLLELYYHAPLDEYPMLQSLNLALGRHVHLLHWQLQEKYFYLPLHNLLHQVFDKGPELEFTKQRFQDFALVSQVYLQDFHEQVLANHQQDLHTIFVSCIDCSHAALDLFPTTELEIIERMLVILLTFFVQSSMKDQVQPLEDLDPQPRLMLQDLLCRIFRTHARRALFQNQKIMTLCLQLAAQTLSLGHWKSRAYSDLLSWLVPTSQNSQYLVHLSFHLRQIGALEVPQPYPLESFNYVIKAISSGVDTNSCIRLFRNATLLSWIMGSSVWNESTIPRVLSASLRLELKQMLSHSISKTTKHELSRACRYKSKLEHVVREFLRSSDKLVQVLQMSPCFSDTSKEELTQATKSVQSLIN